MTTVRQLIDRLSRVRDQSLEVWLEILDPATSEPLCSGGYPLHLHLDPSHPGVLYLSEVPESDRPCDAPATSCEPASDLPPVYLGMPVTEPTRASSLLSRLTPRGTL